MPIIRVYTWTERKRPIPSAKPAARPRAAEPCVADFARSQLGFEPDPVQAGLLDSDAKRAVVVCTRQWGKSTTAAVKAVHRAVTRAGSLVLVASPTARQSAELVRKAGEFVGRLGMRVKRDGNQASSIVLPNGSRIVGLPGVEGTVRGYSAASLLIVDEASRVPDWLYLALRPTLAVSGGDIWLMSTPDGKRGFFYETWAYADDAWLRIAVPATDCPRIPKEFLEEERSAMGAAWFSQEYLCEFVDTGSGLFDRDVVEAAVTSDVPALQL